MIKEYGMKLYADLEQYLYQCIAETELFPAYEEDISTVDSNNDSDKKEESDSDKEENKDDDKKEDTKNENASLKEKFSIQKIIEKVVNFIKEMAGKIKDFFDKKVEAHRKGQFEQAYNKMSADFKMWMNSSKMENSGKTVKIYAYNMELFKSFTDSFLKNYVASVKTEATNSENKFKELADTKDEGKAKSIMEELRSGTSKYTDELKKFGISKDSNDDGDYDDAMKESVRGEKKDIKIDFQLVKEHYRNFETGYNHLKSNVWINYSAELRNIADSVKDLANFSFENPTDEQKKIVTEYSSALSKKINLMASFIECAYNLYEEIYMQAQVVIRYAYGKSDESEYNH